jgi:hypothetical protein
MCAVVLAQTEPLLLKSAWPDSKDPGALLDVVGATFVDHVLRSPRDVLLLVYVHAEAQLTARVRRDFSKVV